MDRKLQAALDATEPYIPSGTMPYANHCLYGEFGSGKTVLAAKLIRRRGLFIVTDDNWVVLKDWPELFDKIELVDYNGPSHLKAIGLAVQEGQPKYKEFDLLCIDTVSQGGDNYIDFVLENYTPSSAKFRDKMTLNNKGLPYDNTIETPGQSDYHNLSLAMRPAIDELANAPIDVVFNCHLRLPGPMATEADNKQRPALTNAVYLALGRRVQTMAYMERTGRTEEPKISFKSTGARIAKSQIRALDGHEFNSSDEVVKIIQDWKEK